MGYAITPNRFAPKCANMDRGKFKNSHSIAYDKCNFRCVYCELRHRPKTDYAKFSVLDFKKEVSRLLCLGVGFKFTGGEPTLNPDLVRDLSIVKAENGFVYLDTNGSLPNIIQEILNKELVDVLGVSIKGLDAQECIQTSSIDNVKLVWENVLNTIDCACSYSRIKTILTYTVNDRNANFESLTKFTELVKAYPNIYLKINNLMENEETEKHGLSSVKQSQLLNLFKEFIALNSSLRGRCILINSDKAVGSYDDIVFL